MKTLVYFSFSTNNCERFVQKVKKEIGPHLKVREINMNDPFMPVDDDYIIVIPAYEKHVFPELYDVLEDFFETGDNIKNCKGIFSSGNRNFMDLFGVTAKYFAKKYDLHIEHNFEFQGTKNDINKMKEVLINE